MSGPARLARPEVPRRVRRAAIAAVAALTTSTVAVFAAPTAVSAADPNCPPAVPGADLTAGQPVNGLTVDQGTTPEAFTGEVLGVINDGIAPSLDMVLVRLTSAEIDRVDGIWSGMSGSPVYDDAGNLVGAVSYGLSLGPSPVAGVTPAAEMYKLLSAAPTSAAAADALAKAQASDEVAIPNRIGRQLVANRDATAAEVDGGLDRLRLPVGVSGLSSKRINQLARRLKLDDVQYYRAGGATGDAAAAGPILAGGNLAATLAYGDLTAGGVGTVTAVCGSEVVGFGHPAFWTGKSTMTMHGADALFVQEDPTLTPYKVANITGPAGRIDNDRIAGIEGERGVLPAGADIVSRANTTEGNSRTGRTVVTVPDVLPDAAAFAHLANLDRVVDGIGDGTSRMRWIVKGKAPNGRPFTLDRVDRVASEFDFTFESIFAVYDQLAAIQYFSGGVPTITDVDVRTTADDTARMFQIKKVEALQRGRWVRVRNEGVVSVKGGTGLKLRVTLASYRNLAGTKTVRMDMLVPRNRGRSAFMTLTGGQDFGFECEPEFEDCGDDGSETFNQLIRRLDTEVRNDQLVGTLSRQPFGNPYKQKQPLIGDVVSGFHFFAVRITR